MPCLHFSSGLKTPVCIAFLFRNFLWGCVGSSVCSSVGFKWIHKRTSPYLLIWCYSVFGCWQVQQSRVICYGLLPPHYVSNFSILDFDEIVLNSFLTEIYLLNGWFCKNNSVTGWNNNTTTGNWRHGHVGVRSLFFFGHRPKRFWNDRKKLSHFSQNVSKYRIKHTFMVSFNTTVRQMIEMLKRKKKQVRTIQIQD